MQSNAGKNIIRYNSSFCALFEIEKYEINVNQLKKKIFFVNRIEITYSNNAYKM